MLDRTALQMLDAIPNCAERERERSGGVESGNAPLLGTFLQSRWTKRSGRHSLGISDCAGDFHKGQQRGRELIGELIRHDTAMASVRHGVLAKKTRDKHGAWYLLRAERAPCPSRSCAPMFKCVAEQF